MISEKHAGQTILVNLALSCLLCNRRKSSGIRAIDPQTGIFARLFDPRQQEWSQNFQLIGPSIIGLTAEGRATVNFLRFNPSERIIERVHLLRTGRYPG